MTSGYSTTGDNDIAIVRYLNDYLPSGLYADFTCDTIACEGAAVQYTDISSSTDSTVLTWNWTFEGGSPASSTVQDPIVTYASEGVYDVRLIVYDGIYTDTLLQENFISIEAIPSQPDNPSGPAYLCGGYQGTFSTNPVIYADNYDWQVTPSDAGTLTENGSSAILLASSDWTGPALIKVRATSQCGNGPWSTAASCNINHDPVQFDLTGEGSYCEGSSGSELILSGSETGLDYELYVDNEPTGIILPGSGGPLNFGYFTQQGIYSANGYTDFCSESMVGQVYVHETPLPEQASLPNGPEIGCDGQNSTYTTALLDDADVYIWALVPEEAGIMTPVFDTAHVTWAPGYTGTATLSVHAENICGAGPESQPLEINVYISPNPEILGSSLVCADYEEKYETATHEGSFYTWEVNGGVIIDGAGTYQATVLWGNPGAGSVTVTEETAEGCTATTDVFDVTIELCEVVTENSGEKIMVYPNPAKDVLNVLFTKSNRDLPEEIKITNSFGQVIMATKINEDQDFIQIDVSRFPEGIYILSMKTDHYINFRFIIIK
jgi:PKD repeat protein